MKKGLILYVLGDKEKIQEDVSLKKVKKDLGIEFISLAFSESDIAYMWWQMQARGFHIISCLQARYEHKGHAFIPHGKALRLSG